MVIHMTLCDILDDIDKLEKQLLQKQQELDLFLQEELT